MASPLKISEAASLALHTMVLLAAEKKKNLATRDIAARLRVSEAHLAKVLQRLGRAGLVRSRRGPGGGFTLGRDAKSITLLDVYEVTEGPLVSQDCLMGEKACQGQCILGGLLTSLGEQVRDYLSRNTLADMTGVFPPQETPEQCERASAAGA